MAAASNQFAFDLYRQLSSEEGNLFFSPASISIALAMTSAGADGETAQQMQRVLYWQEISAAQADKHIAAGELIRRLNHPSDDFRFRTANRLWALKGLSFLPEFLTVTERDYMAPLQPLDFRTPEPARTAINQWVAKQTEGKIPELLAEGTIDRDTRLVLTNAVYFLGSWREPFNKELTTDQPFWISATDSVSLPLMHQQESWRYAEDETTQVLELPYRGGTLSMLILLPKVRDGLQALEQGLSQSQLVAWLDQLEKRPAVVYLPRFNSRSSLSLVDVLSDMGMPLAFSDAADFSGISGSRDLKIGAVVHQAFVDVDEKGTEAAAATGVEMRTTAAPIEPEEPVVFRADHPFLFLIRDAGSEQILFMGRYTGPGN
jgi:serpin B